MNSRGKEIIEGTIEILTRYLHPSKIILFGSRAKGQDNTYSDFDFAVDVKRPYLSKERKMNDEIERISGLYKIDIIYLPSVDKDFRRIINTTGKIIYERRT